MPPKHGVGSSNLPGRATPHFGSVGMSSWLDTSQSIPNTSAVCIMTRGKKTDRKTLVALDDVNLQVPCGELFGLLGPNGAGKTTLIKILTTLSHLRSGSARVAGYDVSREAHRSAR